MGLLTGKTALVTGAARGIGKAIALKFAQEGANIAFTDLFIDEEHGGLQTERDIQALGVKAKGYASNAADFAQTADVVAKVKEEFGYDTVVIHSNSEFDLPTGTCLSKDDVIKDLMDEEDVANLKTKIESIQSELGNILENAKDVVDKKASAEKLQQINNIVLELEKASLNLGSSITAEDRDTTPLSEQ